MINENNTFGFHILNPEEGEIIPLQVETEYTGGDDGLFKCSYVDIMLFTNDCEVEMDVEVLMLGTINEAKKKHIKIRKSDFKNDYLKVRVSPSCNQGQGFKIKIYSKSKVSIQSIAPAIDRVGNNGFNGLEF